jgi:hypothetical protein
MQQPPIDQMFEKTKPLKYSHVKRGHTNQFRTLPGLRLLGVQPLLSLHQSQGEQSKSYLKLD